MAVSHRVLMPNDVKTQPNNGTTTPMVVSEEARREVAAIVLDNLDLARDVLAGRRHWNQSQVGLFKAMLAKVVPDVSSNISRKEIVTRNANDMSREEMEKFIAERAGK